MNHVPKRGDTRFPAQWAEQAVALAMDNSWAAAIDANKRILNIVPDDVSALNRLGRATMELGHYGEAREAYEKALALSPSNLIAQKNLARMTTLEEDARPETPVGRVEPRVFLAEPGKAAVTSIKLKGKAVALVKVAVGEQVDLVVNGRALWIRDARGNLLGTVEQRLARRIIGLMEGGNRYDAALASATDDGARLVIREIYQDPSQLGKISFPPMETAPRVADPHDGFSADDSDDEDAEPEDTVEEADETTPTVEEEAESRRSHDDQYYA